MKNEIFVCVDCESTGLDTKEDAIIEVAVVVFTMEKEIARFESLVNPNRPIPQESTKIHNITDEMVANMPSIETVLPNVIELLGKHTIIGHNIAFDLELITNAAKKHKIPFTWKEENTIDTLRVARLYGDSPSNSLVALREHFNVPLECAHRAMGDVIVNIEVFKHLMKRHSSVKQLKERLKKPILLPRMPLGKHKGRKFDEVPHQYLLWAVKQDFDQDLLFSIKTALKNRKKKDTFQQAGNPFANL